jgi:hypothetical protein
MTVKADVAIMFPWDPIPIQILREIDEKNRSFMKLFTTVIRETIRHHCGLFTFFCQQKTRP